MDEWLKSETELALLSSARRHQILALRIRNSYLVGSGSLGIENQANGHDDSRMKTLERLFLLFDYPTLVGDSQISPTRFKAAIEMLLTTDLAESNEIEYAVALMSATNSLDLNPILKRCVYHQRTFAMPSHDFYQMDSSVQKRFTDALDLRLSSERKAR